MTSQMLPRLIRPALAALALLATAACGQVNSGSSGPQVEIDPYLEDIVMGDASAPVEIVEFASLSCPHCRDFWKQEFPRLKANYIDTGKVKYTLKDFHTPPAELAIAAAAMARCAGPDGYYDVVDDVFSHFHDLMDAVRSSSGAAPVLVAIGQRHGLTPEQVGACANDKGVQKYIESVITEARALGVSATPAIFINGEKQTEHDYVSLAAVIDGLTGVTPDQPAGETASTPAQ